VYGDWSSERKRANSQVTSVTALISNQWQTISSLLRPKDITFAIVAALVHDCLRFAENTSERICRLGGHGASTIGLLRILYLASYRLCLFPLFQFALLLCRLLIQLRSVRTAPAEATIGSQIAGSTLTCARASDSFSALNCPTPFRADVSATPFVPA